MGALWKQGYTKGIATFITSRNRKHLPSGLYEQWHFSCEQQRNKLLRPLPVREELAKTQLGGQGFGWGGGMDGREVFVMHKRKIYMRTLLGLNKLKNTQFLFILVFIVHLNLTINTMLLTTSIRLN